MHPVLAFMQRHESDIIADLGRFVELESPSLDKEAVDRLGKYVGQLFAEEGADVTFLPRQDRGDIVRLAWGPADAPGQILLVGHMDTVFSLGDIARNPFRQEGGRLYGPGTADAKSGFTLLLWALRCMRALQLQPRLRIVALLTSDEELGSAAAREVIEDEARQSVAAFILEPAVPPHGALKTWRKGAGQYELTVQGRSAHAGAEPERGISATLELAHQIVRIQQLADPAVGTTINVGVIQGGSRTNIVAEQATAHIDVRFMSQAEADRVDTALRNLVPVLPGAALRLTGGQYSPPMVRNEATIALFEQAQQLAGELGVTLTETGSGGASDGNLTSGVGCPTLDGLSASGDGLHTFDEYVEIATLSERAALLTLLLQHTGDDRRNG